MNLVNANANFWRWFGQVMGVFLGTRPMTTLVVIGATTVARVTGFLALLLPLKVILLAGSPGVPRYFQFFIEPDAKLGWIIGLSIGAIGLYVATQVLDALSRRLALAASSEVLEATNELSVIQNQEQQAQSYYARFCQVSAYTIFALVALAVIPLLDLVLFVFLVSVILLQFVFSAWAVAGDDDVNPGRLKAFITEKLGSYLGILRAINILGAFLVIITPFVLTGTGNILVALVSFLLLRQMLGMAGGAVSTAVGLDKQRHRINTLVFRDFQLEEKEQRSSLALRDVFEKNKRNRIAERVLVSDKQEGRVESRWLDSAIPGVKTFTVMATDNETNNYRYFQQQVFAKRRAYQLDNEEVLFQHLPRHRLKAPEAVARFSEGPFECQLCEFGTAEALDAPAWKQWQNPLLAHCWGVEVPRSLMDAYSASKFLLQQRLNPKLLERLTIAVDTDREAADLSAFREQLPEIKQRLRSLPLYVRNPDMARLNVVHADEPGDVLIMSWSRWALEPIGAVLPPRISDAQVDDMLQTAKGMRSDIPAEFGIADIRFADACWRLDRAIAREQYKFALGLCHYLVYHDSIPGDEEVTENDENELDEDDTEFAETGTQ